MKLHVAGGWFVPAKGRIGFWNLDGTLEVIKELMVTILGAGGSVGNELVKALSLRKEWVRLASRTPRLTPGAAEAVATDLTQVDQTIKAVTGSDVAVLLAGLKYDTQTWEEQWPKIMDNCIEAVKRSNAKLVFFDNVYMYGKVQGAMTEETPFNPCSKKGEIRAKIARRFLDEVKAGCLTGMIARSADFYGPNSKNGVANVLVFDKLAKGKKPAWMANDSVRHSFTFTPDAARSVAELIYSDTAWNHTWHVLTAAKPPTGEEFIAMACKDFGRSAKHMVLSPFMLRLAGIFDSTVREMMEMLYQNDSEYLFDSTKIETAYRISPTPYSDGIRKTVESLKKL